MKIQRIRALLIACMAVPFVLGQHECAPPGLVARFSASESDDNRLAIQFVDQSLSAQFIGERLWDFGDGMSSTLENPLHLYPEPGLYRVSLTVSSGVATDEYVQTQYVDAVFFLVGEPVTFHNDSYILPLTDPEDIAHARELVGDPVNTDMKIAVCAIAPGTSFPPNRDLLDSGQEWSWHVTAFNGFADFTIEVLDGWPTFVESDVDAWIANTNSAIGFWSYTVLEEIPRDGLL